VWAASIDGLVPKLAARRCIYLLHCVLASGAVYCDRSCLCVCGWRAVSEPYYSRRAQCLRLSERFFHNIGYRHCLANKSLSLFRNPAKIIPLFDGISQLAGAHNSRRDPSLLQWRLQARSGAVYSSSMRYSVYQDLVGEWYSAAVRTEFGIFAERDGTGAYKFVRRYMSHEGM